MSALSKQIDPSLGDCEVILMRLLQFGAPRVSHINGGWYAVLDMRTAVHGAEFTVKSDFGHSSPSSALHQLTARVGQSLKAAGQNNS